MLTAALHESIDRAQNALQEAQTAGQPFEVHRHAARVLDLLDRAGINAVDTTGWVATPILIAATASAGYDP